MNDPRGSIWRKWDLHFHTPASTGCYKNKNITDNDIINTLIKNEIAVVAITDHHAIDTKRIKNLQLLGKNKITVLPGIEFRSELGGTTSIHFIGIFREDCDIESIWISIQGGCGLTPKDITEKGSDKIYCDLEKTSTLIHDLGGVISIHAGNKSNSVEEITDTLPYKIAQKYNIFTEYVDILELGKEVDSEDYIKYVFPKLKSEVPMIICSDNHNANQYKLKQNCWIKADPTFEGLNQILVEPKDRCFIGELPDKIIKVSENKTKYIDSIKIQKLVLPHFNELWFNNNVLLNQDLVAIIGNKGSGKSALSDIIGLLGESRQDATFSFLNTTKFKAIKNNKAKYYEATLNWASNTSSSNKNLNDSVDMQKTEMVKYIPQHFLENICNEIPSGEKSDFDKQVENVIFSHVKEPEKLGQYSLETLISYKTKEMRGAIDIYKNELCEINAKIVDLENKNTLEYKQNIENLLKVKNDELQNHEKITPKEIKKPDNNLTEQKEIARISNLIDKERPILEEVMRLIQAAMKEQSKQVQLVSVVDKLFAKYENFQKQFKIFRDECFAEYKLLGLEFDDVVKYAFNKKVLDEKRLICEKAKKEQDELLDKTNENGLIYKQQQLENKIKEYQSKLNEPNKIYQNFLKNYKLWEVKKLEMIGSELKLNTIKYYERLLEDLRNIPEKLERTKQIRMEKAMEIYAEISKLAATYSVLYKPVQEFISGHPLAKDKFKLNFEVSIEDVRFGEILFSLIQHGASGSFCGVAEGEKRLKEIVAKYDFNNKIATTEFLNDIINNLTKDKRTEQASEVKIIDQLRLGKTIQLLYDSIFSLDYLEPRFSLKLGDKEMRQLSPGEKGTLLLIFYLLVDKSEVPLIIDQPEENLDNQTVYELLVPCIKEAKKKRQIIIVTHNPNLAVVCDAEQVIYASLDKLNGNKIVYETGSIENPNINKRIIDVLEGTEPAFANRDSKYLWNN